MSSERRGQSDERKGYFGDRSRVRANLVSVWSYFKFQGRRSDFNKFNIANYMPNLFNGLIFGFVDTLIEREITIDRIDKCAGW